MAVIDLEQKGRFPEVHTVPLEQRLDEDTLGESSRLPSTLFWPTEAQREGLPPFDLDQGDWLVGEAAVALGRRITGRGVNSAKSWLCHSRVDRTEAILPWGGEDGVEKISPLAATVRILQHLAHGWEQSAWGQDAPLGDQILTVTLPASFDQSARELTLEACREAGLGHARLLEEPQAAFYSWITQRQGRWDEALGERERVLVCDVGGGTSDFSLIRCEREEDDMNFERQAVGAHLLLGGDNIDLALAHLAESRLSGKSGRLNPSQWQLLAQLARRAKENLLSSQGEEETLRLPGIGRKVIGGLRQATLNSGEVNGMVLDGFFPSIGPDYEPRQTSGVQELGLPYEAEPAITWHILDFLKRHRDEGFPQAVLFNGGTLEPPVIRDRIVAELNRHAPEGHEGVVVLESVSLADAVARGAAYYGYVNERGGLRIGGGCAHAIYLGLQREERTSQVCIVPKGTGPHEKCELELPGLEVLANHPVGFELYEGDRHALDEVGALHQDTDWEPVGVLNSLMRFGKGESKSIAVRLEAELTELDTLQLQLVSQHTEHRWNLEFDLRGKGDEGVEEKTEQGLDPGLDLEALRSLVSPCLEGAQPRGVLKAIEKATGDRRGEWGVPFLRRIADVLLELGEAGKRSSEHEKQWFSSAGFCLRPGFGDPLDEVRRQKLWSLFRDGPSSGKDPQCHAEWAILWRRVSPGLEVGRLNDLYQRNKRGLLDKKALPQLKGEGVERWRFLASIESVPRKDKLHLGQALLKALEDGIGQGETLMWCLGRLGTRLPLRASVEDMITGTEVETWVDRLLAHPEWQGIGLESAIVELCRMCGDRVLDVSETKRNEVMAFLGEHGSLKEEEWRRPLEAVVRREMHEQSRVLGESLPAGLRLQA